MLTPFIMLMIDGVSLVLRKNEFYKAIYPYLCEFSGHTLLSLLFMWFYAYVHRFCLYSKISILGLMMFNGYNLIYIYFKLDDYYMYASIIVVIMLSLSVISMIKMEKVKESVKEFLKLLVYPIFLYLEIDIPIIAGLGALMIFDTISGSIKAIRLGYDFKTQALVWGLVIKWLILGIPFIVALVGKITGYDVIFIVETTLKIIAVSEAISIIANIYSAKTKKKVKRIDAISMIFHIVRKSLFSSIQNAIKKIEDSADCNFRDDK